MHRCPNCDTYILDATAICPQCRYDDLGWREATAALRGRGGQGGNFFRAPLVLPAKHYRVRISGFSDPNELGFHLFNIQNLIRLCGPVEVEVDASSILYEWEYADGSDGEFDLFLPPRTPIVALATVGRFLHVLGQAIDQVPGSKIILKVPPSGSPVTRFLTQSNMLGTSPRATFRFTEMRSMRLHSPSSDEVLVPMTPMPPTGDGQLPRSLAEGLRRLFSEAGVDAGHSSALYKVIMEATDNAQSWGGGGWIGAFIRQEKRRRLGFGVSTTFNPAQESHLIVSVVTVGQTFAESSGMSREAEAVSAAFGGFSGRGDGGGGRGVPLIVRTVTEQCLGTVVISSGNYTRIATPDGLIREQLSGGAKTLPGTHVCIMVPLAEVTRMAQGSHQPRLGEEGSYDDGRDTDTAEDQGN